MTDSWDPVWEEIFKNRPWGKYPSESLIRFIARNYYRSDRKNTHILEIGCGPGANIWYLAKEQFAAHGIDGSATAIQLARQRLSEENLQADLAVGDVIKLPFSDMSMDAVVDVECLCCNSLNGTATILQEVQRVLKPGGKLYSRTFTDRMFVGSRFKREGANEYSSIEQGPLAGEGLVRLTPEAVIDTLYGRYFNVLSVDLMEYTANNGEEKISEWIIISEKA